MARRTTPADKVDERTFAVRVRFIIPELGLSCLPALYTWLREHAPREHAIHPAHVASWEPKQSVFLYTNSPAIALECVTRFNLQVYGLPKETP